MRKNILLLLIPLLVMPFVFADISIITEQNTYNLGNKIKLSASVMQDKSFDGLFRAELSCGDYMLQYFLTPLSLEANFRTAVNVPELTATNSMMGNCTITGNLLTNDNLLLEKKESNSFAVTNQMSILPVKTKISSLPGEQIQITGVLNEAYGNNVLKASIKINLDNKSYDLDTDYGKFNLTIQIPKNIKSGIHMIGLGSSDPKGNVGSSYIELEIIPIPTYIKIDLSGNKFTPDSKVAMTPYLYDQADDLVNYSLELELNSPNKNKIFRKNAQSNVEVDYEFNQYAEPGSYVLTGTYKDLMSQASINITTVRKVKIEYKNETVFVENVGNIPFEDELTFILESGLKKYPITKKISLGPGKLIDIDLSKEVPFGIYDVAIKNLSKTLEILSPEKVLAAGATIHDNRPIYKKIESNLDSIRGTLVGAGGIVSKNPILAPMILTVIILLIIVRYGGKSIMKLIKRKKDDEGKGN